MVAEGPDAAELSGSINLGKSTENLIRVGFNSVAIVISERVIFYFFLHIFNQKLFLIYINFHSEACK